VEAGEYTSAMVDCDHNSGETASARPDISSTRPEYDPRLVGIVPAIITLNPTVAAPHTAENSASLWAMSPMGTNNEKSLPRST
jgi:hypothetical protein